MKFRSTLAAIAAVTAAGLALGGCAGSDSGGGGAGTGASDQVLTIGALGDVTNWDPGQAHVGHLLQPYQAPYDSLLLREPDGELAPMLATDWEYDDTNTVLTLTLRDDVTFSDGAVFDADAVVANFTHFQADNGRQAAQLGSLASAEAIDATHVKITLTEPDPAFTYFLSQAAGLMASPEALDSEDLGAVPVGSGPYVMDESASTAGSQYVFTAREDYWNPELQKFAGITFKVLTDNTARVNALMSGQVDASVVVDARSADQLEGAGLTLKQSQTDWQGLLLLDRDGTLNPALADLRVRQAINYGLDRDTLAEALQLGRATATSQVFGVESGAYEEELDDAYPYDPDKARELLAEAGYADGVTIEMPTVTSFENVYAALTQQLSEVGITLVSVPVPDTELVANIAGAKFPVAFFSLFQGESWVAINQIISTSALYNPFQSTTPELQSLIDEVQLATNDDDQDAAAQKVNQYVIDEAWFAPIYRPDQMYFIDSEITVEPQVQQAVPSIYNFAPAS